MQTYRNYEVLTERPDTTAALDTTHSSKLSIVASAPGMRRVFDKRGMPVLLRSYKLVAFDAAQISELRAFIARRLGRTEPFWMPSARADLVVAGATQAGSMTLIIKDTHYAQLQAFAPARRHLQLPSGQWIRVLSAWDNENGTQTLSLESQLQAPLLAGDALQFLHFVRLQSDDVVLEYRTPSVLDVTLDVIELPHETP